jgi:catechol 2,3-dioxygenase-like lactoylglutathione lyase family enzyme
MPIPLKLHHIGCAVPSIEEGLKPFTHALGFSRVSPIVEVTSQQVRVCFIETAPGVFVELVQGLGENSPVSNYLKRRQYYYHLCYSTPNVRATIEQLVANGFNRLSVFTSVAFNGTECAFLLSPELALVELCTEGAFSLL